MLYGSCIFAQVASCRSQDAKDKGLWDAIRAIEERILLLRQRADMANAAGEPVIASRLKDEA